MRSEQEMVELIVGQARKDERIRAVILNGSRANPDAPRDLFQDYDIVYLVDSVEPFVRDRGWIRERFGDLIILQTPDEMGEAPTRRPGDRFAFLMLFADGNRIDLTFHPADRADELAPDSLSVLLLDKDGLVGPLPPASNADYLPRPPRDERYGHCCNEFWWVSTYVAKGLWRGELPYARAMLEGPVRAMLHRMIEWHVGLRTGFREETGKGGKYFEKRLSPRHWEAYSQTCRNGDIEETWRALMTMGDLFRELAAEVGSHYGFGYPTGDDERVTAYLQRVRSLPKDARSIF